MQAAVVALAMVALLGVANGHLCILTPKQRGSMKNLNTPGTLDCQLTKGPCGGRPTGGHTAKYKPGDKITVTLQKNLDHFNASNPGKFVLSLGYIDQEFYEIASTPDTKDPSLSLYNLNITLPTTMDGSLIMQAKYITNNKNAPAVFYQCADIEDFNM